MTTQEVIELAKQDFNDRQECGHYELADFKSRDYYFDGFCNGYVKCQEDIKPLAEDLFSLWESLAEAGEISGGKKFTENYERLKTRMLFFKSNL